MRVIAGEARGRKLQALPGGDVTRPTLDRVKEGMFSGVQFLLPGAAVLDLFAGSGQLGIEALSRGAKSCVFLDQSRAAVQIIRANCQAAGVQDRSRVHIGEALAYLAGCKTAFDLVLLDPPFGHGTLKQVLPALAALMAPGGVVLCESELDAPLPRQAQGLVQKRQYRYGKILVTRYEKEGEGL